MVGDDPLVCSPNSFSADYFERMFVAVFFVTSAKI